MRNNQFLLLGSASIDLLKQSAESLAGRIGYVELTPFLLTEVQQTPPVSADQLWVRGGFPDSYLAPDDDASFRWRTAFIQTYLERDLPSLGPRIPAETLHRFWRMLAHNQAQLLNAASLASSLAVSGQTVARYLDVLVDLLLVRRLEPRTENTGKRIVRSPKVFVRDSGLVHALLGINDREDLLGHPVAGASWEGFVIENIIAAVPAGKSVSFYRTSAGAEIDLILDLGTKEVWAIEIKRSLATPHPSKGFYIACDDIHATRRFVIYPGKERYLLDPKTEVISLLQLVQSELSA